jgi:hypothetical protein
VPLERGRAYAKMGRSEAANIDFDNALTLDPSNEELRRAVEVERATLANAPSAVPPRREPPLSPRPQNWWLLRFAPRKRDPLSSRAAVICLLMITQSLDVTLSRSGDGTGTVMSRDTGNAR